MGKSLKRTVFIVGAGASHEFGLPVGSALQDKISHQTKIDTRTSGVRAFSHNEDFVGLLPRAVGTIQFTTSEHRKLAGKSNRISNGVKHAASIDNYLHAHRSDHELVAIGKLAISACILQAEQESSLAYKDSGDGFRGRKSRASIVEPHNSWIGLLTKTLSAGRDFDGFCKAISTITFVCFNYDRCIERYLFGAAELIYPFEVFDLNKLEGSLNIIHPYGSLGELKPEMGIHGTFGKSYDAQFVLEASKGIRTFTEGMESDVRFRIGDAFALSERAVFLGYGFITVNDDFLFDEGPFLIPEVMGTTYGISPERTEYISDKLKQNCMMWQTPYDGLQQRGAPALRSEGCADLIQRFSHKFEDFGN